MKYSILVVDDEQIERDGICFLLEQMKFPVQIITRNNGKAAEEYMRNTKPDIICSDIKMPFMDGLTFCEIARKYYPDIKIVLLTAYNDFEFAKKAIKIKVDDYILKPVVVDEFNDIMTQIISDLDEQQKENENMNIALEQFNKFKNISVVTDFLPTAIKKEDDVNISDRFAVKQVIETIEREYTNNITLGELAEKVNFSRGYLSAIFKKETGLSVTQYVTMLKMQKAQKLLLQTNYRINDIAMVVGYNDISYFGMIFKRTFGMSPAKMRNGGK